MEAKNIIYRQAEFQDVDKLCELEISVWGKEMAASPAIWTSRLNIFPEGTNIAVTGQDIIGVIVSHIVDWDYKDGHFPNWEEITDNGLITNHTNNGNVMYGVNISVLPGKPLVAEQLIRMNLKIAFRRNIKTIFGCRIPTFYNKINSKMTTVDNKELLKIALRDPEVRFFIMKFGFKVIGFKQDYFRRDLQSLGWGVILELQ